MRISYNLSFLILILTVKLGIIIIKFWNCELSPVLHLIFNNFDSTHFYVMLKLHSWHLLSINHLSHVFISSNTMFSTFFVSLISYPSAVHIIRTLQNHFAWNFSASYVINKVTINNEDRVCSSCEWRTNNI